VSDGTGRAHARVGCPRCPGELISDPAGLEAALGPVEVGGITTLHNADDLTVLQVAWTPGISLNPHEHRMWAALGMYGGREDNTRPPTHAATLRWPSMCTEVTSSLPSVRDGTTRHTKSGRETLPAPDGSSKRPTTVGPTSADPGSEIGSPYPSESAKAGITSAAKRASTSSSIGARNAMMTQSAPASWYWATRSIICALEPPRIPSATAASAVP
jgi:hypothetical protein